MWYMQSMLGLGGDTTIKDLFRVVHRTLCENRRICGVVIESMIGTHSSAWRSTHSTSSRISSGGAK